jgi:hypothetical protein
MFGGFARHCIANFAEVFNLGVMVNGALLHINSMPD